MKIGDIVRIREGACDHWVLPWSECIGEAGVVIALAKRLYIPAAKVWVMGEIAEFDFEELEKINESR